MSASRPNGVVTGNGRLTVHVQPSGPGGAVSAIMLGGDLDMNAVAPVDMYLRRSFGPFFFRRTLLFDLAAVTMIDSSFVAYLVGLAGKVRQSGHDLVLSRPAGQPRRTLGLVGMPNLVPVYESLEEAAELIASGHVPLIPPPFAFRPAEHLQSAG